MEAPSIKDYFFTDYIVEKLDFHLKLSERYYSSKENRRLIKLITFLAFKLTIVE